MPVRRAARRLLMLPLTDVADLVVAQALLLSARRALRRRPLGQLLHPVARLAIVDDRPCAPYVERMATAIDRVARFGVFRPTCLVRAIALERVAREIEPRAAVRIGVVRKPTALLAHAWLECGGRVVGDDPVRVSRFVPLHDFTALMK